MKFFFVKIFFIFLLVGISNANENIKFININYRTKLKSFSGKRIGYYITPQKFECDIDELSDINKYVLKK